MLLLLRSCWMRQAYWLRQRSLESYNQHRRLRAANQLRCPASFPDSKRKGLHKEGWPVAAIRPAGRQVNLYLSLVIHVGSLQTDDRGLSRRRHGRRKVEGEDLTKLRRRVSKKAQHF